MIICLCHRVSERDIAHQAHAGLSFDAIQLTLGVATQCGQCEGCARDLVARCHATLTDTQPACAGQPLDASLAPGRTVWRQVPVLSANS